MIDIKLSPHFTLREFTRSATAEARGVSNAPTVSHLANLKTLATHLEYVRTLLGHPVVVSSAYRNPQVNKLVGGSETSDHPKGLAADIHCRKFGSDFEVAQAIAKSGLKFDQLIYEQNGATTWVHLGFGTRMRQQVLGWKAGKGYVSGIKKL